MMSIGHFTFPAPERKCKMRALLSWSSGKDCAFALHVLREQSRRGETDVELVGLLTTLNEAAGRVAMHAVRDELLDAQAAAAGLPLWKVWLPFPCSNEQYESRMGATMERARIEHIEAVAFGDLFLEDIRRYREEKLAPTGIRPIFPLWKRPTRELAREMLRSGLRAVVTCVDTKALPAEFAGRDYDESFLSDLPAAVDPCGENGEFHTFCTAGPMLSRPIAVSVGERLERDGFAYADLKAEYSKS